MSDNKTERNLLPGPIVDQRYRICSRTRARWKNSPDLKFPSPAIIVNGREYYDEDHLIEWERNQAAKSKVA